ATLHLVQTAASPPRLFPHDSNTAALPSHPRPRSPLARFASSRNPHTASAAHSALVHPRSNGPTPPPLGAASRYRHTWPAGSRPIPHAALPTPPSAPAAPILDSLAAAVLS